MISTINSESAYRGVNSRISHGDANFNMAFTRRSGFGGAVENQSTKKDEKSVKSVQGETNEARGE